MEEAKESSEDEWKRQMDLDAAAEITGNKFEALWSDEDEEVQCQGCNEGRHQARGMGFHRR